MSYLAARTPSVATGRTYNTSHAFIAILLNAHWAGCFDGKKRKLAVLLQKKVLIYFRKNILWHILKNNVKYKINYCRLSGSWAERTGGNCKKKKTHCRLFWHNRSEIFTCTAMHVVSWWSPRFEYIKISSMRTVYPDKPCASFDEWIKYIYSDKIVSLCTHAAWNRL